jgi:hypothetical protein
MDRVERHGGLAGIVTGLLLALLFVMFFQLGMDVMSPDPAQALQAVAAKWGLFAAAALVGLLAAGTAVPFTVAVAARLRDAAPTRARTLLYLVLIGLAAYGIDSVMMLLGARAIVEYAAKDQAAAATAWLAAHSVGSSLSATGGAFVGAGTILAGWATLETRLLPVGAGWVGIIAGILSVLTLFAPRVMVVGLGGFLLTIVWLLWAGNALRQPRPVSQTVRSGQR